MKKTDVILQNQSKMKTTMKKSMRKIIKTAFLATAIVMSMSCTKEMFLGDGFLLDPGVERNVSITSNLPSTDNKAFLDMSGSDLYKPVKWQMTDQIGLNGESFSVYYITNSGTTANFYGTAHTWNEPATDIYWAYYPTNIAPAYSGGIPSAFTPTAFTASLPDVQTYDSNKVTLEGACYMAGRVSVPRNQTELIIQMRNIGSVVKLHFAPQTGVRISKLVVQSNNGYLAGDFQMTYEADTAKVTPVAASATKKLTVNLKTGSNNYIDLTSGANVYVVLPPLSAKDLSVRVYNTSGYYHETTTASTSLRRSWYYTKNFNSLTFNKTDPYFTINSSGDKVVFAPGNLQYQPSTGSWRFAEHQWDVIGNANQYISSSYTGWIDLFGWGTSGWSSGATCYQPYSSNGMPSYYRPGGSESSDLTGTYSRADWGIYNTIGSDAPATWRVLTKDEWDYVLNTRSTNSRIRYAKGSVNGVRGLIILPDNWNLSLYSLSQTNTYYADFTSDNNISLSDWNSTFEPAGCCFLPVGGHRNVTTIDHLTSGHACYYWSSTHMNGDNAYELYVITGNMGTTFYDPKCYGNNVRLVKAFE